MKDRLLKFLNSEELSSARFAEIIGVQPSGVSHVLSGRNNPGYDFIRKTLMNFPSLNAEWLILGKGNMVKNSGVQRDLFSESSPAEHADVTKDPEDSIEESDQIDSESEYNQGDRSSNTFVNDDTEDVRHISEYSKNVVSTNVNHDKVIEKIVILYSDKSFVEYSPS